MQVAAVTPLYPPGSRVGAWLATHECLRALRGRGHDVTVHRYLSAGPPYEFEGVPVNGGLDIETAVKSADVVVAHLGDDGQARTYAQRHDKPLVRMVHGWCPNAAERLEGARLAVFNSQACRREFGNGGPSIVVPPITRADLHETSPGGAVTLVNLTPNKGGELFRLLAASFPDLQFLGVRGGYGRQETHMLPRNVTIQAQTLDMRRDVWAQTRILVMPSLRETWGMAGVEALCSGIPVIAADLPGLRESLGDGAFRFLDPSDLSLWRFAVEALQDADVWEEASRAARARWHVLQAEQPARLALFVETLEALCG